MTDEQLAALIVAGADDYLDDLIDRADRGDKLAARDLHQHIRQDIEAGVALDARLTCYVVSNGLPPRGKGDGPEPFALALAVALRVSRYEFRQDAIEAVAALASRGFKSVEAAFSGDMRRVAEEWVSDPGKRRALLALARPYL